MGDGILTHINNRFIPRQYYILMRCRPSREEMIDEMNSISYNCNLMLVYEVLSYDLCCDLYCNFPGSNVKR